MNAEFINPFLTSLTNVLSTMANLELSPGKPKLKKDDVARGDVGKDAVPAILCADPFEPEGYHARLLLVKISEKKKGTPTSAVITPIGGISYKDHLHVFHSETEVGPVTQKLYKELTGVQTGDIEAPAGWIVKV